MLVPSVSSISYDQPWTLNPGPQLSLLGWFKQPLGQLKVSFVLAG